MNFLKLRLSHFTIFLKGNVAIVWLERQCETSAFVFTHQLKGRQAGFEVARRLLEYQPATKIKSLAKELCFQVLWLLRYLTLNAVVFQAKNSNRPIPYVSHKKISLIWLTFNDITQFKPIQNLSSDHKDNVAMNLDSNRREAGNDRIFKWH